MLEGQNKGGFYMENQSNNENDDLINSNENESVEDNLIEETVYSEDDKIMFQLSANGSQNIYENAEPEAETNAVLKETDAPVIKKTPNNKKKKKKKKGRNLAGALIIMAVILSISAVLAISIIVFAQDMLGINGSDKPIIINIPAGSNTSEIANSLKDYGIISYPKNFIIFCKITGAGANFYPGEHTLSNKMSYEDIISQLNKIVDKQEEVKILFKEGITLYDAAQLLEQNKICNAADFIWKFNQNSGKYDFENLIKYSPSKFYDCEGYFFPDTYQFKEETSPEIVAKRMKGEFNTIVFQKYGARMQELGLELDDVITLASIVQGEAANIKDMKMVSSVLWNRLNNSKEFPKLQSDPTKKYVENVIIPYRQVENEQMEMAYDTYQGLGLPPGAICNPGIDAIDAVLNPEKTDYYFFCSNIETKEFFYAKTNAEHEKNLVKAKLK